MDKHYKYMPGDQLEARREIECIEYLMVRALEQVDEGNIDEALGYHELMERSLRELQRLRRNKRAHDRALFILNQLRAQRDSNINMVIKRLKDE